MTKTNKKTDPDLDINSSVWERYHFLCEMFFSVLKSRIFSMRFGPSIWAAVSQTQLSPQGQGRWAKVKIAEDQVEIQGKVKWTQSSWGEGENKINNNIYWLD